MIKVTKSVQLYLEGVHDLLDLGRNSRRNELGQWELKYVCDLFDQWRLSFEVLILIGRSFSYAERMLTHSYSFICW